MYLRRRTVASLHVAAVALTVLASASCTLRPLQGVLIPSSEAVEATSRVPILIGTTRTRSGSDPGEMFSREQSGEMAFAEVIVSIPPDGSRTVGEIQWPLSPPAIRARSSSRHRRAIWIAPDSTLP